MKEELGVFTKEQYDRLAKGLAEMGYKGFSKYRKGMKSIKLQPIVLREGK